MGIERFFSSIEENNITNLEDNFTYKLQKRLKSQYLLIDFNSIIHIVSSIVVSDLNYLLYQIINQSYKDNKKFNRLLQEYDIKFIQEPNLTDITKLEKQLNDIIVRKVEIYLINIVKNFIENEKLEYFFVAIDGVPSKSKMLEQKKRRYMGTIINLIKKQIFYKYESELMNEKNRYLYEINKLSWEKINISPGTHFINLIDQLLVSDSFKKKIYDLCPKMKDYSYSSTNENGEGEKKIVDYIKTKKAKGGVTIYSPDSDMSLLCLILSSYIKKITIMRFNQQQYNYDIIDIDLLKKNLFNYVSNSLKIINKDMKLDQNSVINDIVFVLTIFGNDFIPKIESFNVKYDFDRIIDKYIRLLKEKKNYIIENNKINQSIFIGLIKILHYDEGGNLQKIYMSSHYRNYDQLKKVMGANQDNFTIVLNSFLKKLQIFNQQIKDNNLDAKKWSIDQDFIKKMAKLTQIDEHNFINNYLKYYKETHKLPKIRITFQKYSKSIDNKFHHDKLEKVLSSLDPSLKITNYDVEVYKLDNILDEYIKKLNNGFLDLGRVYIDPHTYTWKTEKIEVGVKRYYHDFFGLDTIDIKNPKMIEILENYIEGFMWVFDYYFNIFKESGDDIWFYRFDRAPLLTQIYHFLNSQEDGYIDKVLDNLSQYKVKQFFSPKEHLMYVTPINNYNSIIPKEYISKIHKLKKYYLNIDRIVNDIVTKEISTVLDCKGVLFLNKCHIQGLHIDQNILESYQNDQKFMQILKELP